jgi:hypothetical protein
LLNIRLLLWNNKFKQTIICCNVNRIIILGIVCIHLIFPQNYMYCFRNFTNIWLSIRVLFSDIFLIINFLFLFFLRNFNTIYLIQYIHHLYISLHLFIILTLFNISIIFSILSNRFFLIKFTIFNYQFILPSYDICNLYLNLRIYILFESIFTYLKVSAING